MKLKSQVGRILQEKGLKQKWVAEKLGITQKQVSNWVQDNSCPTLERTFELAKLLGVKVDDLYKEVDEDNS